MLCDKERTIFDRTTALEVNKDTRKQPLTESPFVGKLLIGALKGGGYWNSFHMAIQLEDVVDCLKVFRPQFDFVCMFDHSQGHLEKKWGSRCTHKNVAEFGGKQPKMHSWSVITGNYTANRGSTKHGLQSWWPRSMVARYSRSLRASEVWQSWQPWWAHPKNIPRTWVELASALLEESGITVESNHSLYEQPEHATMASVWCTRKSTHDITSNIRMMNSMLI